MTTDARQAEFDRLHGCLSSQGERYEFVELWRDGVAWCVATEQLPPRPPVEPTAPHTMFGELHARAWYLFERVHDLDHANQIKAVKAAPGYPA